MYHNSGLTLPRHFHRQTAGGAAYAQKNQYSIASGRPKGKLKKKKRNRKRATCRTTHANTHAHTHITDMYVWKYTHIYIVAHLLTLYFRVSCWLSIIWSYFETIYKIFVVFDAIACKSYLRISSEICFFLFFLSIFFVVTPSVRKLELELQINCF